MLYGVELDSVVVRGVVGGCGFCREGPFEKGDELLGGFGGVGEEEGVGEGGADCVREGQEFGGGEGVCC